MHQGWDCAQPRARWRQREVIRLHCAASARGFAEERLETTGRGLGARWKQQHVSPSPPNDPQGRKWVVWTLKGAAAQQEEEGHAARGQCTEERAKVSPAAERSTASPSPANAKLRRVTAAKLSRSLRWARIEEKKISTAQRSAARLDHHFGFVICR